MGGSEFSLSPFFCSPTLPTSRQAARADLEHVSPSKHTHISTQKPLVPPCLAPKLSLPGRRDGWRASNGDGGRFKSEIGAYRRGRGGEAKMVSHYREEGEREEASRKVGARQASSPSSRLQKGSEKSSPSPSREQAWGTSPRWHRAVRGWEALRAPPPPPQASKWRLAAAAARLCPGMGWGWWTGRVPNQMPPAWAWWLPAHSADPTSPSPEPLLLKFWGWRKMGTQ